MNRRDFLLLAAATMTLGKSGLKAFGNNNNIAQIASDTDTNAYILRQMVKEAQSKGWDKLPIGDLISKMAKLFVGVQYQAGTLDSNPEKEELFVSLTNLDCLTLVETMLALARIIKKDAYSFDDLKKEICYIRYRGGKITDYTSRLHYTAEWILDGQMKRLFQDSTQELGGEEIQFNTHYMSKNPDKYPALLKNPKLIDKIESTENYINSQKFYYLPKNKFKNLDKKLRAGDIICITSNIDGLDYAHLGIVVIDEKSKQQKFFHASSAKGKTIMDAPLSKYIAKNKNQTGITVLKALSA